MRLFFLLFIWVSSFLFTPPAFAEEGKRCVGLLWCIEEKNGRSSVDALFYLYSSEEKEDFSRLTVRPFYSHEIDGKAHSVRRSILWPLGTYERKQDYLRFHVFPLYWQGEEPHRRFKLAAPFYLNYEKDDKTYFHLFPFYGRHTRGLSSERRLQYEKNFFMGPLLITTHDPENDFNRYDILYPLFKHRTQKEGSATRLIPFYFSGYDLIENHSYRYILPFYGQDKNAKRDRRFLFPLYGREETPTARRTSLLGLPPINSLWPLPTLSLYEHARSEERITDRFFPLYRYEKELNKEALRFSMIGHDPFSIFGYDTNPASTEGHLFPIYSYEKNKAGTENSFGLLGYGDLSLYRHQSASAVLVDRLFPLYDYRREGEDRALSLAGVADAAIYRHVTTPTLTDDRLSPLYHYRNDRATKITEWNVALVYNHRVMPTSVSDLFFPLYDYERDTKKNEWQMGILGLSPFSIYAHHASPELTTDHLLMLYGYRRSLGGTRLSLLGLPPMGSGFTWALYEQTLTPSLTTHRLFPLYRYWHNKETDLLRWDALFIYQHQKMPTYMKDVLLPFHHYENDVDRKTWQLGLIGVPPLTLFRHKQSPDKTTDYLFPVYSYKKDADERQFGVLGYDNLSVYVHEDRSNGVVDRLFPLYWYSRNNREETDLNVLLLYNHEKKPRADAVYDSLFPLYSFEKREETLGFSMIGFNSVSLFRYAKTPDLLHHRLLPLYTYNHDLKTDDRFINVLLLYTHRSTPNSTRDLLFPIYDYQEESGRFSLSLLGVSKMALYQHESSSTRTHDRIPLLYRYTHDKEADGLRVSVLGAPPFSLYEHRSDPSGTHDRLFPLYSYNHHRMKQEHTLDVLFFVKYQISPDRTKSRFFPFYSYEVKRIMEEGVSKEIERRIGVLGWAPFSLYQHHTTEKVVFDRFLPLYSYSFDRLEEKGEFSVLWPLFNQKKQNGRTTETSLLWWLFHYERPKEGEKEFRVLGGSAMAVLRKKTTPTHASFEFNPVLPFYSYKEEKGKQSEWNLLGGLLGMRTIGEEKKVRVFFMYF